MQCNVSDITDQKLVSKDERPTPLGWLCQLTSQEVRVCFNGTSFEQQVYVTCKRLLLSRLPRLINYENKQLRHELSAKANKVCLFYMSI